MEILEHGIENSSETQLSFLKTIDILKEFTQDQLVSLLDEQQIVCLNEGEALFRQGDSGESIFIVKSGSLKASITKNDGTNLIVSTIKPGQTIGEMQILFDGLRTASVAAFEPTTLLEFPRNGFRSITKSHPDIMEKIIQIIRHRFRRDLLADLLPNFFGPLDEKALTNIESMIQWVDVQKGDPLFLQNQSSDNIYIVINGTLHAFSGSESNPKRHFLRTMGRGDCIGEMGILSGENRSASVFAARDCLLAFCPKNVFHEITAMYPVINRHITKVLIKRLQNQGQGKKPELYVKKIAIIPAGNPFSLSGFIKKFSGSLFKYGSVLHLSSQKVDKCLGIKGISQVMPDDPYNIKLATWLDGQEAHHRFILFEVDPWASPWTLRSVADADQIILAGQAEKPPNLGSIEKQIFDKDNLTTDIKPLLLLLHKSPGFIPDQTKKWLKKRDVKEHHHICPKSDQDLRRLARFITNRAVGLVLGGGGARGFAHIGVIRALEEEKIPIDIIGGTSMGAIIAAQYAMGWDLETILKINQTTWVQKRVFKDYTLPVYSILKGRRANRISKDSFGDTQIEDLPINYFCVSSNLTKAKIMVHQKGSLWKSVRASGSLPGIFQPWIYGSDLHVDGGILNNLPGDIMKDLNSGFLALVDVSPTEGMGINRNTPPSPWSAVWKRIFPFLTPNRAPKMLDILIRSTMLASIHKKEQIKKKADIYFNPSLDEFGLLEFKAMEKIIESGYCYAKEKISRQRKEGLQF